jgi:RHS repeat-associated protein
MPFRYQGQYEDVETGLCYNRFRYYDPQQGNYISQDPIGLAGGNPTLYGYVKDPNIWVDPFGLECGKAGTATIHKYDGNAENPFGHFSVEVNHNGKTVHTHQVITSRDHSTTTIIPYSGKSSSKSVTVDIPDAEAAHIFQKSAIDTELGPYNRQTNSCVDHVAEVLRQGGVEVPKSAIGQFKYLKSLGLF